MEIRWLLLTSLIVLGCRSADDAAPVRPTQADLDRADAVSRALSEELAGRLFEELERSGPIGAIEVCSEVAQRIAREKSGDGLTVRRVSRRTRNPADEPDAWELEQLEMLERQLEEGPSLEPVSAVVATDSGSELRYLKPLRIAPPCLTCHGDRAEMDSELVARLAELYPWDSAVGYRLGDLRGAVSVRLALERAAGERGAVGGD